MKKMFLLCMLALNILFAQAKVKQEYYQITVYHFKDSVQQNILDDYLQHAYLPALHKKGYAHIGVFKPIANDTTADKIIYVIVPFKTMDDMNALNIALFNDAAYLEAGKTYLQAPYDKPPYTRIEKIITYAFPMAPQMQLPNLTSGINDKVYELRSYESATEMLFMNKVHMFNEGGEIDIFARNHCNAIFYSSVVSGAHMPNLMYMTSYENMAERDAHWKAFGNDPVSKKIFNAPEYKNNMYKADITLMHATAYSDY